MQVTRYVSSIYQLPMQERLTSENETIKGVRKDSRERVLESILEMGQLSATT
ncbi:hypothetical protein WN55_08711 [Dufourea novaeangliae]|uniref:Uncharacterized protein n=1 Tax=Dufourea novaeangliae TaxID=178035 RepID=A0A154P181_DUFNO|nr:hypothetical protein WN55_08711 [Dufourea novaeangliae]